MRTVVFIRVFRLLSMSVCVAACMTECTLTSLSLRSTRVSAMTMMELQKNADEMGIMHRFYIGARFM